MGAKFKFVCPGCGYIAKRVSDGRDVGMIAVVRTMTCKDCEAVVDVLIGRDGKDGRTGDPNYDKELNICPQCQGSRLYRWPSKHPCPKCDAKMIKDKTSMMFWD